MDSYQTSSSQALATVSPLPSDLEGVNMPIEIWPNFFIVGAVKCGTTSLWAQLKEHPEVFFPRLKEPYFFQSKPPDPKTGPGKLDYEYIGNQAGYLKLFKAARGYAAIGEASPTYLCDENAPRSIQRACPGAKIIAILRDPVIRAHSHFLMHRRLGKEPLPDFCGAIKADLDGEDRDDRFFSNRLYVQMGLYSEQVRRYIDTFGREHVLVLLLDELARDPLATMKMVTDLLGIRPIEVKTAAGNANNSYRMPRRGFRSPFLMAHRVYRDGGIERLVPAFVKQWLRGSSLLYETKKPQLDMESRRLLQKIFDPDIVKLEVLLGRELPELRKSWM